MPYNFNCCAVYPCRSITLDNQLVVLATTAADAGRYHVEAVNDMTGENATSPAVYLSISGEEGLLPVCLFFILFFLFKSFACSHAIRCGPLG